MRIAAVLCWWDEPCVLLDRCVHSLAGVADIVVAVDGVWNGVPTLEASSPLDQVTVIQQAAHQAGVKPSVLLYQRRWESQVAKRNAAVEYARDAHHPDWLLIIDADEHVTRCDPIRLRRVLADTTADVCTIRMVHVTGELAGHETGFKRRLYRCTPGLHVSRSHNGYANEHGPLAGQHLTTETILSTVYAGESLELTHDASLRSDERMGARDAYYAHRRREKVEA